jgi:hypothetical protein
MKKNVVLIYSVFAVIIYLFSILFFCTSLYKEYSKGKQRTVEDFNFIVSRVSREFDKSNNQNTITSILNDFTGNSDKIAEINLENNGRYLFAYPEKEVADSKYVNKFSYSFSNMQNIYNLNAKMYILRPSVIYHYGKISFLLILAVTFITLLLILYTSYSEVKKPVSAESKDIIDNQEEAEDEVSETEPSETDSTEKNENSENEAQEEAEENNTEQAETTDENTEAENKDSEDKAKTEISFEKTVEEELNASIANEKEFAIFVMKVIGIEQTSQEYRMMIELLEDRMKAQRLIFEGKDNCILILKHDTNLDENLALAENTINEIENTFPDNKPICYIGISNRNQRIVTPQRLLFEAEAALNHAEETEEKVIAFRANTEQYNNFINQQ